MKNLIIIGVVSLIAIGLAGFLVAERDPLGWLEARREADKIIAVCKARRIYNKRHPYTAVVYHTRRIAELFELDRKLVYAIIIRESEFNPKAKNINFNKSLDMGLMQINSIWNGVILSDAITSAMFGGRTNKRLKVEDFIYEIEHNIFMGCYILRHKLTTTKTLRAGITRYNGSGYWAEVYADAVLDIYHEVCRQY